MKALVEFYDHDFNKIDEIIVRENVNENIRKTALKKANEHMEKYNLPNNFNIIVEEL